MHGVWEGESPFALLMIITMYSNAMAVCSPRLLGYPCLSKHPMLAYGLSSVGEQGNIPLFVLRILTAYYIDVFLLPPYTLHTC